MVCPSWKFVEDLFPNPQVAVLILNRSILKDNEDTISKIQAQFDIMSLIKSFDVKNLWFSVLQWNTRRPGRSASTTRLTSRSRCIYWQPPLDGWKRQLQESVHTIVCYCTDTILMVRIQKEEIIKNYGFKHQSTKRSHLMYIGQKHHLGWWEIYFTVDWQHFHDIVKINRPQTWMCHPMLQKLSCAQS